MDRIWRPSVTVAAVIERAGEFLLIEERTNEGDGRRVLNQPAGHWEPGETLIEACVRETLEECGHAFTPEALVGIYRWRYRHGTEDVTFLRFTFAGALGARDPDRALDPEILGTVWMRPAAIADARERHRSPLVQRSVDDYLAGRRYPLDVIAHIAHDAD